MKLRNALKGAATVMVITLLLSGLAMAVAPYKAVYKEVIGEYGGVPAVSNGDCTAKFGNGCNILTTAIYQCVEYTKRFYREAMGMDISLSGNANTYYATAAERGLDAYPNSGSVVPQADDLIVFNGGDYGHVAIITAVRDDSIDIIEQNWDRNNAYKTIAKTGNTIADRLVKYKDGTVETYSVIGWLRRPGVHIVDQTAYCGGQVCSPENELIPGSEVKLVYKINNPYPNTVDYNILAAQIRVTNPTDQHILYEDWNNVWIDISGNSIENNKIINLMPGTYEYTRKFIVPETVDATAGNYDIRMIILDSRKDAKSGLEASNGNWNGSRVIKNTLKIKQVSQIPNPTITVVSPDIGENWVPGSQHNIVWTSTGNPGGYAKIKVYPLSRQ